MGALALAGSPAGSLAATPPGTAGAWHGTAEGIDVDFSHYTSGDVDSTSSSNYQVELSFTFSVSQSGAISGGGNGYYTDAHWHLYGNNGSSGPFDCDPPITAAPFPVEVSGHASGDQAQLSLAIPDATESNADYDCGGDYTGYSSSTHVMSESLSLVDGDDLAFSLAGPASFAAQKQTSPNSDDVTRNDVHIWTFSFTPPASTGGSPGQSGGAAAGANRPGSCDLSLSDVSAKPASATPGHPIAVSFRLSAPAHAALLLATPSGPSDTVAALNLPAGKNALVWGGWVGKLEATGGRYQLTVTAQGCDTTRKQTLAVTVS